MVRRVSRRRLLAGSVPLAVGLAGCSGDGEGDASGDDGEGASPGPNDAGTDAATEGTATPGSETATATPENPLVEFPTLSGGDPTYRQWQPGTEASLGLLDAAHHVSYAREHRSDLPARVYEDRTIWAMYGGYVGVEYGELEGVLVGLTSPAAVYLGTFERADVTDRLTGTPYARFETAEGIDYYRWDRSSGTRFVGVGDEGVVAGPARRGADDPARAFVEGTVPLFATAAGDQRRLHEASATYERYSEAMGWPLVVWSGPLRPGDGAGSGGLGAVDLPPGGDAVPDDVAASVRVGFGSYVAGDDLVDRYWLWTTEDGPAGPEAVRAAYDDPAVRAAVLEGVDDGDLAVRRDGRVVEVGVVAPISDPGGGADPPLVATEATREGDRLTLAHYAGDPLPLSRVAVRGAEDASFGEGDLTAGESVATDVPAEAEDLVVVYEPPASPTSALLGRV